MSTRSGGTPAEAAYDTPWGQGRVTVSDGRLIGVDLPRRTGGGDAPSPGAGSGGAGSAPGGSVAPASTERDRREAERWAAALEAYFRGERLEFSEDDVLLDGLGLGDFVRRVYAALLTVPAGTTVSYGELARMAGHPRAARAVGSAMASNPIPIVVPCHRVVHADGSLGRYGDDPGWKPVLLEHEVVHAAPKEGGGS